MTRRTPTPANGCDRRSLLRRVAAPVCALATAGCVVGPNYRTPDRITTAPVAFAEAGARTLASAPPGRWWRLYDDPELDRLVDLALTHNTDLRQAEASLAQARASLSEARADLFPATAFAGGASYGRSSNGGGSTVPSFNSVSGGAISGGAGGSQSSGGSTASTGSSSTSSGSTGSSSSTGTSTGGSAGVSGGSGVASTGKANWTYNPAFDASYELDLFGRIRHAIQAARADVEALAAAEDLVRVDVAAETARAYASACAYGAEADVQRRSLEVVSDNYEATVRQRDLGSTSDFEVANARTLLEQTRAPIAQFEASRRASLYGLAVLTGERPEQVSPRAEACRKPPALIQAIPIGDGAGLIRRRPDVREAERRLAATSAQIGVATADLYPTISLGGGIAAAGHNPAELGSRSGVSYGLGPLVTWNFPNLIAARARIRGAEAATQIAYAAFDGAVLSALQNVEQSIAAYGGELDRNTALRAARDQAEEAFRLANVRLQAGSISFIDTLTIERTLTTAQSDLAASDTVLIGDQVSVFKALGGGWDDPAPIPLPPLPAKGVRS